MHDLLDRDRCLFVLIDVQPLFVSWDRGDDSQLLQRLRQYLVLSKVYRLPTLVTLEQPVDTKGQLVDSLKDVLSNDAVTLPKTTFDLCADPDIGAYIDSLHKDQVAVAGSETDVCVLQSCLGLLARGKQVFLLVDGIFSSATNTQPAIQRMIAAGVVPMTYKSFFYELLRSVDRNELPETIAASLREAEETGDLLEPEDVSEPTPDLSAKGRSD